MSSTKFYLNNLWRWKCGLSEMTKPKEPLTLTEIKKSQWSERFEELRVNRMILGFFRYGPIKGNPKKYDIIGSAIKRLQAYQETGNGEYLVDSANMCMIEFMREQHPNYHFESVDDGDHAEEIK